MRVVVTGASSGIGRAIALAYAARGAAVGLIARREERLAEVAEEVRTRGGSPRIAVADVGDLAELDAAIGEMGDVDVLVNNAGTEGGAPFVDIPVDRVEQVLAVNTLSAMRATRAVLPAMIARGTGAVVFVSSVAGRIGVPSAGAYSASKFALAGLAESLDLELANTGVHVCLVDPGPVRTETWPHRDVPKPFVLTPERVARRVVRAVDRRRPEIVVPSYYRVVYALGVIAPPLYRTVLRSRAR